MYVIAYNLLYIYNLLPEVDPWTSGNLFPDERDERIYYHLHNAYYYAVIII